jgi:hypothetical protein
MIWFLDKRNTPKALIVVLALFLLIDGFLFYRYQIMETTAASVPSLDDAVPSAAKEGHGPTEQEEEEEEEEAAAAAAAAEDKGPDNEAARSDGEKKGNLEAQENDSTTAPTPFPPDSAPPAGSPTPVAAENAAVLPAQQEGPVGAYPDPVYEE